MEETKKKTKDKAPEAAIPGGNNFRSKDFDQESKYSIGDDNNHDYVPEGTPNRKQEFHDFSAQPTKTAED